MANHKSAKKRARQAEKKKAHNLSFKRSLKTLEKKLRLELEEKKQDEAQKSFQSFMSKMAKLAQKGFFHKNKASRKISQMAQKLSHLQK